MSYLDVSYANYSAEQCFELTPSEGQVACSAQHLNITDPPSIYSWEEYPFLWEPITCMLSNVTYRDRIDLPDNFNWCSVPLKGSDAFLFAALALVIAGCLFGKLSAVWVLVAGAIFGTVNNYANLLQISNGIAIWLGISPPDLFFYAFLPPLLVDSAIRIDFFMFSKLSIHILMMAFVMVVLSAVILTPLLLFVLGFSGRGFTWVHGALFAAMIASTDALAATAILKQGGGPEKLVVLMEGEALLNDASAITLFEVFSHILEAHPGAHDVPTVWSAIPTIIKDIFKLASIGLGVGLAMSIGTGYLLRWLRWRGAKPAVETTIVLAVAYLSFYVAQSPAQGSGVISVVVFGLWGNYTSKWGMLASTEESGSFDAFWDTISFASNGLVFFWAGVASINYFIRSIDILGGNAWSYAAIPLIYIFMMLIRTGCLALFNVSVFAWIRERLSWAELVFTGWSGLRGAISLIMTADFIAHSAFLQGNLNNPDDPMRDLDRVNSDISIWTASFVVLTLIINAPSISMFMRWLRLDRIPPEKQEMRAKAKRALLRFTDAAIETLREDDEEFLQGANWEAVAQYVDVRGALKKFDPPRPPPPAAAARVTVTVVADGEGEAEGGKEAPAEGAAPKAPEPLGRKSIVHSVSQALLMPLSPFLGSGSHAQPDAGAETDASAGPNKRRRRRRFRACEAPASLQLGQTQDAIRDRMGVQRQRRRRDDSGGRPFTSGVAFSDDNGSGSDLYDTDTSYESDTSSSRSSRSSGLLGPDGLFRHSDGSAGVLLDEVVEECPFIQQPRQGPAPATMLPSEGLEASEEQPEEEKAAAAEGDIEMGLGPAASLAAAAATAVTGAAALAAETATRVAGELAAAVKPESGADATPAAAPAVAAGVVAGAAAVGAVAGAAAAQQAGASPSPARMSAASASPAAAADGEEEDMSAEHLAFIRRQQRQQQRRPTLGSLFAPGSDSEQTSPHPDSPHREQSGGQGAGSFTRPSSLQTITEHQQQVPEQQQEWLQQQPTSSVATSEAGGDADLMYYSSMPAALGRQLQQQLRQQQLALASQATAAAEQEAGAAASAEPDVAAARPAEDLYYSSMPAAAGRQLARQLQQQLAAPQSPQPVPLSPPPPEPTSFLESAAQHAAAGTEAASPRPAEPPMGYYSSLPAAVGRQLGAQLKQRIAAAQQIAAAEAAATTSLADAQPEQQASPQQQGPDVGELPAGYYSSLPAAVGRQLAKQLQQERLAQETPTQEQPVEPQEQPAAGLGGGEEAAAYYSSLPAQAGRNLQRQLQQQLAAAGRQQQQPQQSPAEASAEIQPAKSPGASEDVADHYSTMPAALGRALQQDLARQLSSERGPEGAVSIGLPPSSTGTSFAAAAAGVGRLARKAAGFGSGRELQRPPRPGSVRLGPSTEPLTSAAAAAAGVHPAPPRPAKPHRLATQAPPQRGHPAWEEYHRTVTGAAGPSLQAELQRQLRQQRSAGSAAPTAAAPGPLTGMPQRDLLGRKVSQPLSTASSGAAEGPAPSSDLLARLVPLSARGPGHTRMPSWDSASRHPMQPWSSGGMAAAMHATTPVAAHLQMRRSRTLDRSRRKPEQAAAPRSFALPLPLPLETADLASLHRSSEDVYRSLTRRSAGLTPSHDTSWQHKPVLLRSMSRPTLAKTSATLAARAAAADGSPAGPAAAPGPGSAAAAAAPIAAAPSTILSRAYSGVSPLSLAAGAAVKKPGKASSVLQRLSYAGSAGSASLHGGTAFANGMPKFAHVDSGASSGLSAGVLSEMRSRLIAGLKRYFHSKRMEGLLSAEGLRILEYACDHSAEHTAHPLGMWRLLEKEVAGNLTTRIMARTLMLVAKSWRNFPSWLQYATSWPVRKFSGFLRRLLGQRMLVSCEVAVEYYLSLIHSPQIQWLQQSDEAWPLQQEVEGEVDAAYRFIIDREIEAPDRFQAIQSYRAAMAVLRQQLTFVHELYESGMVDEGEKDDMVEPLDKRMRHLEITGPVWKPPRPRTVLRGLPFMQVLPEELFRLVLQSGTIKEYKTGVVFWSSSDLPSLSGGETGPGAFVVLSGVVRRVHQRPDGSVKEFFQGIGGVVGSLLAMTGVRLPGNEAAIAEGNTLGKGPVLFHVPQSAVALVKRRAAEGDPAAQLLRIQLLRLAAAFVTESCDTDVVDAIRFHLLQLAAAKTQRQLKRRPHKHSASHVSSTAAASPRASQQLQPPSKRASETEKRGSQLQPGLHRTSSLARLSSVHQQQLRGSVGAAAAEEGLSQQQLLQRQAPPAAGGLGLRHAKSFGGHLAELMQQIAMEEFEDLKSGGGEAGGRHLAQVDEGEDEGDVASPHPSEGTAGFPAGGSSADLPALAAAGSGAAAPSRSLAAAANGSADGAGGQLKQRGSGEQVTGGATAAAVTAVKAARSMRQRARAAERRAPQYAAEVLADIKRGLSAGIILHLPAGLPFAQTTHAILLQGELRAAGPPLHPSDSGVAPPSQPMSPRSSMGLAGSGDVGSLRRASVGAAGEAGWEADLTALAGAAAAPAAPRILPWLWSPRYRCNATSGMKLATQQVWQAGPSGALLLVLLTEAGEVPEGVLAAEEAAAAQEMAAVEAEAAAAAAAGPQSHPLDLTASGSIREQEEGGGAGLLSAPSRHISRIATMATTPAQRATSGLLRLMPWQHRQGGPRGAASQAANEADGSDSAGQDAGSGAPSSIDGSLHSSTPSFRSGLRVPLERMASTLRGDSSARPFHTAR